MLAFLLALTLAFSFGSPAQAAEPRLVTIGGAVTETACHLGFCAAVVGSDESSLYPEDLAQRPRVGYYRSVSAEGVLSLKPTLVLATDQTEPKSALDQIRAAGVKVVTIPDDKTVAGAKRRIEAVAAALGAEDRGAGSIARIDAAVARVQVAAAALQGRPKVLFVYARGAKHLQVAGKGTAAFELLTLAGGEPAVTAFEGYKPMTSESVAAADPDIILMTAKGRESVGDDAAVLKLPGVGLTKAGRARRFLYMDDLLLLGFGPRVGEAIDELFTKLHGSR